MSTTLIFGVGVFVSFFCVAFLALSFRELKRLGKEYDQTHGRG